MSAKTAIRVGDRVRFDFGAANVTGTIQEDRGPIGVRGRHLYLITFVLEPEVPPFQIELPAVDFEVVRNAASPNGP
jgi:hypothetical protein